jgi:hypothetical protein
MTNVDEVRLIKFEVSCNHQNFTLYATDSKDAIKQTLRAFGIKLTTNGDTVVVRPAK